MIPIPKLGMAIHNNKRPKADSPSGFDLFRGTMVIDARSHSFSRNPTKLGLDPWEDGDSSAASAVIDASLCAGPRNSGGVPPNPASKDVRESATSSGLLAAEAATDD